MGTQNTANKLKSYVSKSEDYNSSSNLPRVPNYNTAQGKLGVTDYSFITPPDGVSELSGENQVFNSSNTTQEIDLPNGKNPDSPHTMSRKFDKQTGTGSGDSYNTSAGGEPTNGVKSFQPVINRQNNFNFSKTAKSSFPAITLNDSNKFGDYAKSWGEKFRDGEGFAKIPQYIAHQYNKNPWAAGGIGTAGGALLGLGAGAAKRFLSKRPRYNTLKKDLGQSAATGAVAGGLGSLILSSLHNYYTDKPFEKKSSFADFAQSPDRDNSDVRQFVKRKLSQDTTVNFREKSELSRLIDQLSSMELSRLENLLSASIGGGAGFIVAKYLLGLGFKGQILSALTGAASLTGINSGGYATNTTGQKFLGKKDFFGNTRPYFN